MAAGPVGVKHPAKTFFLLAFILAFLAWILNMIAVFVPWSWKDVAVYNRWWVAGPGWGMPRSDTSEPFKSPQIPSNRLKNAPACDTRQVPTTQSKMYQKSVFAYNFRRITDVFKFRILGQKHQSFIKKKSSNTNTNIFEHLVLAAFLHGRHKNPLQQ